MTEAEFRRLVMPLKNAMYGMALRMGIPPDDAADRVQNTLIGLWRGGDGIPAEDVKLRSYCMTAFRNECVTYLKRIRFTEDIIVADGLDAPPERDAEYDDTRNRLECLIRMLPAAQQRVIRLSAFGGMSNEEIAETMGVSETNVRQLLSRGRRKLKNYYDSEL